jgi:hypothetical protein
MTKVTNDDFGFPFDEVMVRFQVSEVHKGDALGVCRS